MSVRHSARLWALAGAIVAVAMLLLGWFVLIGPQRTETNGLADQLGDAQDRVVGLQRRLNQLREQERNLPQYREELAVHRAALPSVPGTPDFVRQLQAAGDKEGVEVSGVAVGEPEATEGSDVFTLSITLTADGTMAEIEGFLDQLQQVQPRVVLFKGADITAAGGEEDASLDGEVNVTLNLAAFVAPNLGTTTATN